MSDFQNQFFKNVFDSLKLKGVWMISLVLKDVQENIEKEYNRDSVYHKPIQTHDEFITLLNEHVKNNLETIEDIVRVILRDFQKECEKRCYLTKYSSEEYNKVYKVISHKYSELKEKLKDSTQQKIMSVINEIDLSSVISDLFYC